MWRANNAEIARGSGDNAYIRGFATSAATPLYQHFAGAVSHWQIWNEPNGSAAYLYPSNFAWLLARAYIAARESGVPNLTIIAGGLLSSHSITTKILTANNCGANYLRDTYWQGIARAGWAAIKDSYGTYPLDGIGQHLYIDQWYLTTAERIEQAVAFVHDACAAGEDGAAKPIYVTELGWSTDNVSEQVQADNLKTAFIKLKQMPCVALAYWFFLKDVPNPKLAHGLLRADSSEKPAWTAFQDVNSIHIHPQPQSAASARFLSWGDARPTLAPIDGSK